jgi:hypothetical protein
VLGKPVDFRITTNSNNSLTLSVSNNYQGLLLINATNGTGNQLLKGLVVK